MSHFDDSQLRYLCRKRIRAAAGFKFVPIEVENVKFDPSDPDDMGASDDTLYLRETVFIADESKVASNTNMALGEIRYDVFVMKNDGTEEVSAKAKMLVELFEGGQTLTDSDTGFTVQIRRSQRSPGVPDESWYFVPVSIFWRAFTASGTTP